ncbi:glycosyltransferase family 2 protein [Paucibacter sp. Y2R2-4]|uniref:glycosyltransferase family 2 protein n=1 Tax=Paucibacter sp. Y2R2-4 TaxID=2893553 RepID=UPI0021E45DB3|nr:glycosyltransferase family A protein [Paucibacter sp. Y2R2-4]MCV2351393.1 glycosyltransferase family 2 protein [Paucibacter sp. Y2R2-4]
MKILFAIPFFSNVDLLKETIDSVLKQTNSSWNLVILDDSISLAEAASVESLVYGLRDNRVTLRRNHENLGMAKNWNQALDLGCEFDLVNILHADDKLCPDFAENMLGAAEKFPDVDAFFARTEIIDASGKNIFSFADRYKEKLIPLSKNGLIYLEGLPAVNSLISGNYIFCPTLCYRPERTSLRFNSELKMVLDFDLILRGLLSGKKYLGLYTHQTYQYRRHKENATSVMTKSLLRFKEEVQLYDWLSAELRNSGKLKMSHKAQRKTIVKLNICFQIASSIFNIEFKQALIYFRFLVALLASNPINRT